MRNPGIKIILLGVLALLLLIPLSFVQHLVFERQARAREAEASIAAQWGQAQLLAPAYLVGEVPVSQRSDGAFVAQTATHVLLPDSARVVGTIEHEVRHRGLFELPVYTVALEVTARFSAADIARLAARIQADSPLKLRLALSDARGVRALGALRVAGMPMPASAAGRELAELQALGLELPADLVERGEDLLVAYSLTVAGARDFRVLPLARTTVVELSGAWPDPSFAGAYLPGRRTLDDSGFRAHWQVLEFNREYPQSAPLAGLDPASVRGSGFGVSLYQPADAYQQNERSGKYGVLMIALLFLALFLFEVVAGVLLHPIQYLLVGLALATFYLLLLALSEHIGFGAAYATGAGAAVAVVGGYAAAVLGSRRRAVALAALQSAAYAMFYLLVRSEDYALLLGATALFSVLALAMYLTRRTDWYALGKVPA